MTFVIVLSLGGLLLLQKLVMALRIATFFRRQSSLAIQLGDGAPKLISILQPILSGDPTLPRCLEENLQSTCSIATEFWWLVDDDDEVGLSLCRQLIDRYPDRGAKLLVLPPPRDRCNPKMLKLQAALEVAEGDVICVLDDDTVLPPHGLETAIAALNEPQAGLAFGLPYYVSFDNFWSKLVAFFVNSHSLLTYVPFVGLVEPFTINGMFYVFRREVFNEVGGFTGLEQIVADDFAVAQRFWSRGRRLIQTSVRHPISTHVAGIKHYARLLQRWFIFPRESVMKALPWRCLAVTYGLSLLPAMAPLLWCVGLWLCPQWEVAALGAAYIGLHYAVFAWANVRFLRNASPWRWSWLVVCVQCLLPLQLLLAMMSPQRIHWRGHVMQIERGGQFHFVRRRS